MRRAAVLAVLLLLGLAAWLTGPGRDSGSPQLSRSRLLLGTVVEITAFGTDRDRLETAVAAAFAEIERIEALMAVQRPDSDVARFNAAPRALEVSPETATVLALSQRVAAASSGAFDPTLGRVKALWGLEGDQPRIPSAAELAAALAGGGPQALCLDGRTVVKTSPELQIDLGGIAKGFAVDRAIAVLAAAGITQAAVNAGGDLRLLGDHQGRPWRIAIQHPRNPQALLATLELEAAAVVTSGDYERYFERDGIRYHHLFDPATGHPARRCQSVTVVAASAAEADALATAAFVLGPEAGLAFVDRWPGAAALLVGADGAVQVSASLKGRLQWP